MIYFNLFLIWIICFIATGIIAANKRRNVIGWLVLAWFFAPFALVLLLFLPKMIDKKEKYTDKDVSLSSLKQELEEIKNRFRSLVNRLDNLEVKLSALTQLGEPCVLGAVPAADVVSEKPIQKALNAAAAPLPEVKTDMEMNMGRFWLNKIGIIVFTLGVGFLISYSFKFFGAPARIAFGYFVSACLFFFGIKFEKKERFLNYGRVLLGGAWAITYFTTYAMHHFDASRIIDSQLLALVFLAIVSAGIIAHSLRYKSQELCAVSVFIGYLTATLGDISQFTLFSCGLLAIVTLVLVYKMQWIKIIFVGIAMTYLTHLFWVARHIYTFMVTKGSLDIKQAYFLINGTFLFIYWYLFTVGIHIIKSAKDSRIYEKLAAANFCNFLLFFFIFYPKLLRVYPTYKFDFVFGLGVVYLVIALIMHKIRNNTLFNSNIIISLSLMTLALPLKFISYHTSVIWLVELPFLLLIGLIFNRRIFRYFSFVLALLLFFKFLAVDFYSRQYLIIWGKIFAWDKFLSLLGLVFMPSCFYIGKYSRIARNLNLGYPEKAFYNIFSALACAYLAIFTWLFISPEWLTFSLSVEVLVLFLLGFWLSDRCLRVYSLAFMLVVLFRFCFIDSPYDVSELVKWFKISAELIGLYIIYFVSLLSR